ncbi:histidine kinase [Sulfurospirillum barnesii SES-3]|uniref:histidine kinase n=2 Tax=Sulfurospirillum barnesii TaxID=44674 RepID=I3XZX2_SULBS|nr:histidine kinase [Sulfurospirillum barnesii SES-3]
MNLITLINHKLETIKFSNKTKILIVIILSGIMTIGFLMFVSIFALKYDYETLFQKHTQPQVDLEEIKDTYRVNINETLRDIQEHQISHEDAIEVIQLAQHITHKQWERYQYSISHHIGGLPYFASRWLSFFIVGPTLPEKTLFQQGIIEKINSKMYDLDRKMNTMLDFLHHKTLEKEMWIIDEIMLETNSVNIYLSSLITTHLKQSITEKQINDRLFQTSTFMLIFLIGLIFFFISMVLFIIIKHFENLNHYLQENISLKTKELRMLNDSLEQRIKKEVENSRKKDNIMFQQARLASLGEMLQNIAHQWRQPLGSLMMIIQSFESKFLAKKLSEEFVTSRVADAQMLAQNMSDTLEDFRTFFNPNKSKKECSLKDVVQKSIELSKYQLEREEIHLQFFIKEDLRFFAFKNELIHVLLNLIGNSKDVLATKTELEMKIIHIIARESQDAIYVNVIDNGGGIKSDIIPKVFDPYFTTKHKSVGTGIGLFMSKQMVEKHMNGEITCKNIRHKLGTKKLWTCAMFTITIPKKNDSTYEDNHEQA